MATLKWSSEEEAWTARVSNAVFKNLQLLVVTDGKSSEPTEIQLQAVAEIESMTQSHLDTVATLARSYAEETLEEEDLEEMEEEDFEMEIYSVTIPRLRTATETFAMFAANSEIDIEHGLGCLCKNGQPVAIIDADEIYGDHDWDAVDEFNELC